MPVRCDDDIIITQKISAKKIEKNDKEKKTKRKIYPP